MFMKFYVAVVGLWLCSFALPSFASCVLIACWSETYAKTQNSTTLVLHLKCSILPNCWHFDYFHQSFLLVNKTISAAVNMLIFLYYRDDGLTFIAHSFALPLSGIFILECSQLCHLVKRISRKRCIEWKHQMEMFQAPEYYNRRYKENHRKTKHFRYCLYTVHATQIHDSFAL